MAAASALDTYAGTEQFQDKLNWIAQSPDAWFAVADIRLDCDALQKCVFHSSVDHNAPEIDAAIAEGQKLEAANVYAAADTP